MPVRLMHIRRWVALGAVLVALGTSFATSSLYGQAPPAKAAPPKSKVKIPEPEDVTVTTKDGVQLRATFFAGIKKKDSIPIIMLHGYEGQRGEYEPLAKGLQLQGYAIIVPDLRGHGQSTTQKRSDNTTAEIDAAKFRQAELEAMILDVEACKKFLMDKNNAGELNINALCVIGSEFSSIIAMRWAALDLSAPPLLAYKQGQDVKAVVLLSPMQAFKGVRMQEALNVPAVKSELSTMIVVGRQGKSLSDAKRLHTTLAPFHAKVSDPEEVKTKQDLFLSEEDTSLQGTKLLGGGLPTMGKIARFLEWRLKDRLAQFPWSDRSRAE